MLLAHGVDWTAVLVYGIPSWIAAVLTPIVAVVVARNRRELQTPSGDPIGHMVERTHDITHATNMLVRRVNGEPDAK